MTRAPFYIQLGNSIRLIRKWQGLTQKALAQAIGLSRPSVVSIEGGKQAILAHTLADIAKALNVDVAALLSSDKGRGKAIVEDYKHSIEAKQRLRDNLKTALKLLNKI